MNTATLFDLSDDACRIAQRVELLAEQLDSDDPVAAAKAATALESLLDAEAGATEALLTKADAYCWVIERLRASAAARASKVSALRDLASADNRRADALLDRLVDCLQRAMPGKKTYQLAYHKLSSRMTESVVIDPEADLSQWPEDCLKPQPPAPNKTGIKAKIVAAVAAAEAAARAALEGDEISQAEFEHLISEACDLAGFSAVPGARLDRRRSWRLG